MNNIGRIMYNDLGNNGRIHYDKIVGVLRPGQLPADVELTIDELMIVVSALRAHLKYNGNLDPYWDLLQEINRNTRATWKCTAMRMPALADTPANGGECTPVLDTPADTTPTDTTPTDTTPTDTTPTDTTPTDTTPTVTTPTVTTPTVTTPTVTTPTEAAPLVSDPVVTPSADNLSPEEQKLQECRKRLDEWYKKDKKDGYRKIYDWLNKTGRNRHIDYFAMTGNIEMLECAHSLGWVMSADVPEQVAKSGDVEVFDWMRINMTIDWLPCAIAAITAGHLPVLKIIRRHCVEHNVFWSTQHVALYTAAASAGRVNIINWLWMMTGPIGVDNMEEIASKSGNAAVIAWCNDILH